MPATEECLLRSLITATEGFVASVAQVTAVPTTPTSDGAPGQIAFNLTHLYVCVAEDTWRRVAISTW